MTAEAPEGYFGTEELARLVNSTPDDQLANGLRANGDRIVQEFFRRFPERGDGSDRLAEDPRRPPVRGPGAGLLLGARRLSLL